MASCLDRGTTITKFREHRSMNYHIIQFQENVSQSSSKSEEAQWFVTTVAEASKSNFIYAYSHNSESVDRTFIKKIISLTK